MEMFSAFFAAGEDHDGQPREKEHGHTKGCQNVPEVQSTSPEAVHRPTHELADGDENQGTKQSTEAKDARNNTMGVEAGDQAISQGQSN